MLPHVSPESDNMWLKYKYERYEHFGHSKIFKMEEDDEMAIGHPCVTELRVPKRIWMNLEKLLDSGKSADLTSAHKEGEAKMFDL